MKVLIINSELKQRHIDLIYYAQNKPLKHLIDKKRGY